MVYACILFNTIKQPVTKCSIPAQHCMFRRLPVAVVNMLLLCYFTAYSQRGLQSASHGNKIFSFRFKFWLVHPATTHCFGMIPRSGRIPLATDSDLAFTELPLLR